MSGRILLALGLVLGLGLIAAADDLLDRFARENTIKTQKLLGEVNDAVGRARQLEGRDPAAARDALRKVLIQVEDAAFMPEKQRANIEQQLRNRIDQLGKAIRAREAEADRKAQQDFKKLPPADYRPPLGPPKGGPGSIAEQRIGSAKGALDVLAYHKAAFERGYVAAQRDIFESAAQGMKEERVSARYLWGLEHRHNEKLSKEEKAVLKALNSVMSVDFDKTRFKDAIEYIQEKTGINILLHENSLKDAMVEYDDPVNFKIKKTTVRTILRKVLYERGLSYIIKEGAIHVLTAQQARETLVTRTYPIADLVSPDPRMGPFFGQAVLQQNVNQLIQLIQNTIDPQIWQSGQPGGPSITFFQPSMALVVRAPAELHLMMGYGGLKR